MVLLHAPTPLTLGDLTALTRDVAAEVRAGRHSSGSTRNAAGTGCCATTAIWTSGLQDLGLRNATDLDGGFRAWTAAFGRAR